MNKIKIYVLLACLWAVSALQAQNFGSEAMRKLQMAEFAISHFYVDKVDEDKLVEEAIIKMLAQLDPHSTYSDAEEVKKMNEPLQGNFEGIGVQFQMIEDTLLVVQPVSNGPSEKVGILAGDRIVAVGGKQVATWNDMVLEINSYGEKEVVLSAERNGVTRDYTLKPEYDKDYGKPLVGISPQIEHKNFSIFESLKMGFKYTEYITLMMLDGLYKIVTGAAPADVTGPIGIAKIAGEAAENGWMPLLNLTALLSINLGIINLLPLPALDGGHFVLLVLEALRGKPLGEKAATMIQSIGVGLILTLTVWAVFSDISR